MKKETVEAPKNPALNQAIQDSIEIFASGPIESPTHKKPDPPRPSSEKKVEVEKESPEKPEREFGSLGKTIEDKILTEKEAPAEDKKEEAKPEAKKEADKTVDDDVPAGVSSAVSEKFKAFKAQVSEKDEALKAAQAEIETLKAQADITKNPDYLRLKKEVEEAQLLVEQLDLEKSPKFKERFDAKIERSTSEIVKYLKSIRDEDVRQQVSNGVKRCFSVPDGEDNDPEFISTLDEVFEDISIGAAAKSKLIQLTTEAREMSNDRHKAMSEWKATAAKIDEEGGVRAVRLVEETNKGFDEIRRAFIIQNGVMIEGMKKVPDLDYDGVVSPIIEELRGAVANTVRSGTVDPRLIHYAQVGAEAPVLHELLKKAVSFSNSQKDRIAELEKLIGSDKSSSPGYQAKAKEDGAMKSPDRSTTSGILATAERMGVSL